MAYSRIHALGRACASGLKRLCRVGGLLAEVAGAVAFVELAEAAAEWEARAEHLLDPRGRSSEFRLPSPPRSVALELEVWEQRVLGAASRRRRGEYLGGESRADRAPAALHWQRRSFDRYCRDEL